MNKINASPQAMLIVRLAAAQAPLHWQLFAPGEPHHEASGRWPTDDASPFPALAEQYPAWVLIPASDCAFHSLTLPAGLRKPPLQVAPFLLEEQLADDVEATHFALLHRQQAQCEIVAVQRQKMRDWLARCESLSLQPLALTPDVLALPWQPPAWSAVQVDEQWLIRHQPWGGMAAENVWPTELLQSEAEEHVIDSYSPPPAAPGVWREQPAQTLLTLAARHPAAQKLAYQMKGRDGLILVTDSLRACLQGDGESSLGGQKVFVKNGEARLADGTLAASIAPMNEVVLHFLINSGASIPEVVAMATVNPAKALGVYDRIGSLEEGKQADITILDSNDFHVKQTVIAGELAYNEEA